jgi:hypothetical protein
MHFNGSFMPRTVPRSEGVPLMTRFRARDGETEPIHEKPSNLGDNPHSGGLCCILLFRIIILEHGSRSFGAQAR